MVAVEQIVLAAYASAASHRLDPYLLLAVISVESSFNPLAESKVGAKGLMQVMPEVHRERFQRHGGTDAALNPWANIDVGAGILREYLDRFKTIEAALSAYVGMGPSGQTQYPSKVLRIRDQLYAAAQGRVLALARGRTKAPGVCAPGFRRPDCVAANRGPPGCRRVGVALRQPEGPSRPHRGPPRG